MKKLPALALVLCASSLAFAQTVATVNGQAIDSSRIDGMLRECAPDPIAACSNDAMGFSFLLGTVLNNEPYRQEALKMGLRPDPEAVAALDALPESTAFFYKEVDWPFAALRKAYADQRHPSDQEIEAAYKRLAAYAQKNIGGVDETAYREIVVKDRAQARKALAEIKSGRPFVEVMLNRSVDPGKTAQATAQGLKKSVVTGEMNDRFGIGALAAGEVSHEPFYDVEARVFRIFKAESVRPAQNPSYEQSKEGVRRYLKDLYAFGKLDALKRRAQISCDDTDAAVSTQSTESLEDQLKNDANGMAYLWL